MTVAPLPQYKPPAPWFGGKGMIAPLVWELLGAVAAYHEPFFGMGHVLFGNPQPPVREIVNDADGYLANFWRAVQQDPEAVAQYADWPVNELDLHARHAWLTQRKSAFAEQLREDPDFCSAKHAGWWVWGLSAWIGSGWCAEDARPAQKRPHLNNTGKGLHRQIPHLGSTGQGSEQQGTVPYLQQLQARLRHVWVCCGDWARIVTPAVLFGGRQTPVGIFLDPPYHLAVRDKALYATDTAAAAGAHVSVQVRQWATTHGDDPRLRIVICGYDTEAPMPDTWRMLRWKANGGYGNQANARGKDNAAREVLWASPHCVPDPQLALWEE